MDRDVFRRVVLEQKDRVHTYAAWMLRDPDGARDVTQQALMRLWEHRSNVAEAAAGTWLRRTAHRLCVDRLRRRGVARQVSMDALLDGRHNGDDGPEGCQASTELKRGVGVALGALGAQDRAVVMLREVDGMSYEQMSDVLGIPLGTLKARLHRARDRLRRALTVAGVHR